MIALYARVSTRDHGQDTEVQMRRLREWAERVHPGEAVEEFVDQASAADLRGRIAWRKLLGKAPRVVAVVRLDRAFRSTADLALTVSDWGSRGIGFFCLDQPIDTATALGRLTLTLLGAIAEFERELIRERVRDGLVKAAAEGRYPGRPRGRKDRRKRKKRIGGMR